MLYVSVSDLVFFFLSSFVYVHVSFFIVDLVIFSLFFCNFSAMNFLASTY